MNVGVGVDEVHATNAGTTAIANKANKALRCSTTIAKTLPCMAKTDSIIGREVQNKRGWAGSSGLDEWILLHVPKASLLPVWGALGVVARATDLHIISYPNARLPVCPGVWTRRRGQ